MPDYKLLTILTIRSASERLPDKALKTVAHRQLVYWLIERLRQLPGELCLATTADKSDDTLSNIAIRQGIPVWRDEGDVNDVVGRMNNAVNHLFPDADYVFRALGDCPFIEPKIVKRAVDVMEWRKADAFLWYLPPGYLPFYGAREFPYSRKAWNRITRFARARRDEREHVDNYFNNHRDEFRIVYHEPPPLIFFPYNRPPYRLEIDYPDDMTLVRKIANDGPGMLASMDEIIQWLDNHHSVATINLHHTEKTGPSVSFTREQYKEWWRLMQNQPVITWRNKVWDSPDKRAQRVFCRANICFVGWGVNGLLYTTDDSIIEKGFVNCNCGAGRNWEAKL